MVIGASKEVYSLDTICSMPLNAESRMTIAATHTAIPTTEMREMIRTIDRFDRLKRYRFAM